MKLIVIFLVIQILVFVNIFAQQKKVLIYGLIKDSKTDESLSEVQISIHDSITAITNEKGYFDFVLAPGVYLVNAKKLGYNEVVKSIKIDSVSEEKKLFFGLYANPIELEAVTVIGESFTKNIKYSSYDLQAAEIMRIPQLGETDIFRAMYSLPGIVQVHDFSAQLYIQGGNFDETLIAIDDVPLYNPYHLGGIFGIFNPEIVFRQTLYTSNYPSSYGGYLSSVFNVLTKEGNSERLKGTASVGLISSKLFLEGPLGGGTFVMALRRTYFDLIAKLIFPNASEDFPYNFSDYYLKYTYPFDAKNLISISAMKSNDVYKSDNSNTSDKYFKVNILQQPNWGDDIYNLLYTHILSYRSALSLRFYYSTSYSKAEASSILGINNQGRQTFINNSIKDFGGNLKFEFNGNINNIEAGIEKKRISLSYKWDIVEGQFIDLRFKLEDMFYDYAKNPFGYYAESNIYNLYFIDQIAITKELEVTIGIRGEGIQKLKRILVSPNFKVDYYTTSGINFTASYSHHYQYLYTIKESRYANILSPYSAYFLSSSNNNLATSDNFVFGVEKQNIFKGVNFEGSGYLKLRNNLASSYNTIEHYKYENGYALGVDLLLTKKEGDFTGWIGYSFSRAVKKNEKYIYFTQYDRTHNFKMLLSYNLSESWQLTSFWTYATGLPFTPIIGRYIRTTNLEFDEIIPSNVISYGIKEGRKNSKRFKAYNRLDIGITGSFIWGNSLVKPYLQIMNVYNSANQFFIEGNPNSSKLGEYDEFRGSFIVPTIGLSVEF